MKTTTNHTRTIGGLSVILTVAMTAAACSAPPSEAPAASADTASPPAAATEQPAASPGAAAPAAAAAPQPAAPPPAPEPVKPAPPPKPRVAHLSAGQVLTVRTTRDLSTKTMKSGDPFSAILEKPVTANDWTVAVAGARVDGRIVEADKGGRVKGKANLSVELTSLTLGDGRKIEIVTSPIGYEAAADKGKDAKKVGIGAGAGAAVGAIAGGGSGAAVGALVGAGAGVAMRGDAAEIPAETVLAFELRSPITIEERK